MKRLIKIFKIYFAILTRLLSRLLCWKKRNRRNSGSLLPTTLTSQVEPNKNYNYSSHSIVNKYTSNINDNLNLMGNTSYQYMQTMASDAQKYSTHSQDSPMEVEPDYFQELKPTIKRQKKILLKQNEESTWKSDRLNFNSTINLTPELGLLDENSTTGWEEETSLDVDLDESLKNLRAAERERRIADHKRAKMEKELRKAKSQKTNFMATKIS